MIGNPSAVKYRLHSNLIEENITETTETKFDDSSVKSLSGRENVYRNSRAEHIFVNLPNSTTMSAEGSTTTYSSGGALGKHLESIVSDSNMMTVEMQTKNMKIMQVITDWFESWQSWQRRILLTGLINRFDSSQLRNLLMAVEPVFHKDFVTKLKKVYPLHLAEVRGEEKQVKNEKSSSLQSKAVAGSTNIGSTKPLKNKKTLEQAATSDKGEENRRVPSPAVNASYKVQRSNTDVSAASSRNLSPIEEGESAQAEENEEIHVDPATIHGLLGPQITHLINESHSSGMSSNVSTLVASLSPIEETSTESGSIQLESQLKSPVEALIAQKSAGNENKRKGLKMKFIPNGVIKRISSSSTTSERSVKSASQGSSRSLGSNLEFQSNISGIHLDANDFFDHHNEDILGAFVSTRSKIGSEFRFQYDKKRNFAPLPTMQQLYKNEKFWIEKENIVKPKTGRLKEQFRQQLQQIWTWISDWTPSERMKILLQLFSSSPENAVHYAAQCIRNKFEQMLSQETSPENLPEHLLLRIFSYLKPFDLSQARLVCKRWYTILNNELLWKEKCADIGRLYGMNNLVDLLDKNAADDETLDWERACNEVYEYLSKNMEPVGHHPPDGGSRDEESSSESEEEEISTSERFKNYVPISKAFPVKKEKEETKSEVPEESDRKQEENEVEHDDVIKMNDGESVVERRSSMKKKEKGGFLQMWKNITEDIQNANLEAESGRSDACYDVDLLLEMQGWNDVELFTSLGQRFAVDFHVNEEIDNLQRNSMINFRVFPVRKVQVFKGHQGAVNCVKAHGSRIFSGSVDRQVRCWSLEGECFAKMTGLKGGINDISLPPEDLSRVMFIASWDMSVTVWDSVSFKLLRKLVGHNGSVVRVAADAMYIVSCSHDGTIRIWDRKTYKCDRIVTCHTGAVQCMVYHDRQIMTGGVDRNICVTNPCNGNLLRTFVGHTSPVTAIKKQHDLLASGDANGFVLFWSLASTQNSPVETVKAHESQVNAIIFNEGRFFTASNDALVKEWDLVTMTSLRILQGHTDGVTDVQYTDKYLLTASKDNDVRIWWWKTNQEEFELVEQFFPHLN